jgi:hypothetical protein
MWLNSISLASNLGFKPAEPGEIKRLVSANRAMLVKVCQGFIVNPGSRVINVSSTDDLFVVELEDGRTISVPLAWFPRLLHASQKDRDDWQVAGGGFGIHWPTIDEDLSVDGLLRGAPAPRDRVMSS